MKRFKTEYPGVFYREAKRSGGKGVERVYFAVFKKNGKTIEAKVGRQFKDDMSPAKANNKRTALIEGREITPQAKRNAKEAATAANAARYTINKLWATYCESNPDNKALEHDKRKFELHLKDGLGKKEPYQLVALDVDRLRLGLQKAGKRTQAARVLEILRRIINFGLRKNLISPLPFKIEIPRLNNQTTEDLTEGQLKALLLALDADEDQAAANIMRLALYTGMRRSEIFKLKWADLDFERKFISIRDPKGGSNQTIPMNDAAEQVFKIMAPRVNNPYVFPGRKEGSHLTECRKSIDRIKKAANLPAGFRPLHGLRHVFASMLASSGEVDLYVLQRLLTHKSPQMKRYAHLRDDALKRASGLAGSIISGIGREKAEKEQKA